MTHGWGPAVHKRKFTFLLIALGGLLIGHPLLNEDAGARLAYEVLEVGVFLAALLVLFQRRASRVVGLVLGLPMVLGAVTVRVLPDLPPAAVGLGHHLLPALFFGYVVAAILRTIFRDADVTMDEVNGAICGYLLLGFTFGHLYCMVELMRPGSFAISDVLVAQFTGPHQQHSVLTYFSLITLSTVGYGDVTPRGALARSLAAAEAVMGQFYVAVIVADLVGRKVSAALRGRERTR